MGILARIRLSQKGQFTVDLMLNYNQDTKVLKVSSRLFCKTVMPFSDEDQGFSVENDYRNFFAVDGCQFFDIIGEENKQGKLVGIEFTK